MNRLDRNGVVMFPIIYCMECSGGTHVNMHKGAGHGRCYVFSEEEYKGKPIYKSRCRDCGWVTSPNREGYFRDYEVGNEIR